MTVKPLYKCRLTCDSCAKEHATLCDDGTTARIIAAADGWTFIQYTRRIGGSRRQQGPRTWDACSDCKVPPTADEAYAIVQARGGAS